MKATDILRELGFTDEQLKSFFKGQEKRANNNKKLNAVRQNLGMTKYQITYTPRKLVNRIKANVSEDYLISDKELIERRKNITTTRNILEQISNEQSGKMSDVPQEVYTLISEFITAMNSFSMIQLENTDQKVNEIVSRYINNLSYLVDRLNKILEILYRYVDTTTEVDSDTGEIVYMKYELGKTVYYPELNQAINEGLTIYYG